MATFTAAFFSFLFGLVITVVIWDGIEGPESIGYLVLIPISGVLFLLMLTTGYFSKKLEPEYYPKGIIIGLVIGVVFSFISEMLVSINQSRPTILEAKYFNEEGIDLLLRKNGTFMVVETNIFETRRHYGSYSLNQDTILLSREVHVNGDVLSPKFYFVEDELCFHRSGPHVRAPRDTMMYIVKDKIRGSGRH